MRKRPKYSKASKKRFAQNLRDNLPASEEWFWMEWKRAGMVHVDDLSNEVFKGFIPDVINKTYKYIIEIDGPVHNRKNVQKKDAKKDKVFERFGYTVFRLEAYNDEQIGLLMDWISTIRSTKCRKTILRKALD
jgi:very-short-patch-repair endonuclease